jgi:hypothetical protein
VQYQRHGWKILDIAGFFEVFPPKKYLQEDEEAFQTFAVYCGLALHHAKLYDKIRRSEQKNKAGSTYM